MRKLVISAVLVLSGLGLFGCQPKDSHEIWVERQSRLSWQVDSRGFVDDIHSSLLLDERPSHLTFFIQE